MDTISVVKYQELFELTYGMQQEGRYQFVVGKYKNDFISVVITFVGDKTWDEKGNKIFEIYKYDVCSPTIVDESLSHISTTEVLEDFDFEASEEQIKESVEAAVETIKHYAAIYSKSF